MLFRRITRFLIGSMLLTSTLLIGLYGCTANTQSNRVPAYEPSVTYGHDPIMTQAYLDNGGDCHFAYPPQLLPKQSWQKIMANLDNHFDDNAELEAEELQIISDYLARLSDKPSLLYRAKNDGAAPIRITQLKYFTWEHHDFPRRWVEDNPEVVSLSNCNACHRTTSRGEMFDEHSVDIPGVW